jgi:hypothetical protein
VEPLAALPDADAQTHYGIAMRVGEALRSADRTTLNECGYDSDLGVLRSDAHCRPRALKYRANGATIKMLASIVSAYPDALR